MVIDEVLISALGSDRRAALLSDGRLVRFSVQVPGQDIRAGDVIVGRITSLDRRLGAAFVDIGAERAGLLMLADAPDPRRLPSDGDSIVLSVVRAPEGNKGAKLSGRPPLPVDLIAEGKRSRPPQRLLAAPDPVHAAVAAALGPQLSRVVVDDAALLAELRSAFPDLGERLEFHRGLTPLFAAEAIDEMLEAALAPRQTLPSGGAIHISETPAVTAIDVDLAAAMGPGNTAARTTNLEAMAAIGAAIQLRDLAGHIVIDPLAARDRSHRAELVGTLRDALVDDERVLRLGGFTTLGLIELTRERRGPSLRRQMSESCAACADGWSKAPWVVGGDALRAILAEGRASPGRLPRLVVPPAVADALTHALADARTVAEERLGGALTIQSEPRLAPTAFCIEATEPTTRVRG